MSDATASKEVPSIEVEITATMAFGYLEASIHRQQATYIVRLYRSHEHHGAACLEYDMRTVEIAQTHVESAELRLFEFREELQDVADRGFRDTLLDIHDEIQHDLSALNWQLQQWDDSITDRIIHGRMKPEVVQELANRFVAEKALEFDAFMADDAATRATSSTNTMGAGEESSP